MITCSYDGSELSVSKYLQVCTAESTLLTRQFLLDSLNIMFSRIFLRCLLFLLLIKMNAIQAWMPVEMHKNERPLEESDNDKH